MITWKPGSRIETDAEIAARELDRIAEKYGALRPENVVEESRPENAPLHGEFEWDDKVAAELYRVEQARYIIRSLVIGQKTTRKSQYAPMSSLSQITMMMAVRNATGVADLRVRAMWRKWSAVLRISYDGDQFSLRDVANLLMRVGQQVGIGEGRPDSKSSAGMGWGTFVVEGE